MTIVPGLNSQIEDFDFEQIKNDFEGELWNLITSKKSKVMSDRLELKYCSKIFRYPESKLIIDFLSVYDKISQKPKSELLPSKGTAKLDKVKPIAETYRKLVTVGSSARVLPSKTFIENYDTYENRYLCLMLNTIYKIIANNIHFSDRQQQKITTDIEHKRQTILSLQETFIKVNPGLLEAEIKDQQLQKMSTYKQSSNYNYFQSHNWQRSLTPKEQRERNNQVQTLQRDIINLESQLQELSEFIQEQRELLILIEQRLKKTFFKTIKWHNLKKFTPSMTFIQNIDYRKSLNLYKQILESEGIDLKVFDLYEQATNYGIRETPQVYELWCLVSMIKILKEAYNFEYNLQDIHTLLKIINPENSNFNEQVTINFSGNLNGRTITLYYQKTLQNNKRPDFILEITTDTKNIHLVFDAKFKNYNYKKSLNYEIESLKEKYDSNNYYVFVLHPCNDLTWQGRLVKMTNHGGDKIYFGEEENRIIKFPFHKYGYITHKPNCTDNLKKLIGMAFEYLLDFDEHGENKNNNCNRNVENLFCLNCGSTKIKREPQTNTKQFTAKCEDCGHQAYINYCWKCKTTLFKHGYYWDYHKTSVWSSFDIHCPKCGMTFADRS